jgi:SAM-dependent methyltransferase
MLFEDIKYLMKYIVKIYKKFIKTYNWKNILIIFAVILLVKKLYDECKPKIENFTSFQSEKFLIKKGNEVYDEFYCSLYDELVLDPVKNKFEYDEIKKATNMNKKSNVLDVGCGTGHHVNDFNKNGIKCIGVDKSQSMINKCREKYNGKNYKRGDILTTIMFQPSSFTHITCLYFTIYSIEDKLSAFKNFYDWLKPGGYLILNLVNRDKFDPIVDAGNPLLMVSPQKYAKKRITNTVVKFNDFQYKSNFEQNTGENIAYFKETFQHDSDGKVRKNEHILHMDTQKDILGTAKNVGFILKGKIDMVYCMYEYQYLYVLYKPN